MNKESLWTKDFTTVTMANFLLNMNFYILMVIIAPYAIDKFHASTGIAGLASGIFIIGILIGRMGTGRIIGHVRRRRLLVVGTMLVMITSASYLAASNLPLLIVIRFLHGLAFGVASTTTGTIVVQIIPGKRLGEGIGYYSMSQIVAAALGPFIGITLSQHVDFKMISIVSSVVAAISFATSSIVGEPTHKIPSQDKAEVVTGFQISRFLEFKAIPISIIASIGGFGYSIVLTFITIYSRQLHLEEAASFFFLVYALAVIVSRPFSGRFLDVKGQDFVVYPCLFIFTIGMFLLSQANHGVGLLLSGAMLGLGYGNLLSCGHAISVRGVPPHRLGLATATYYMFLDLGFGLGPYIFGSLVPLTGYRGLYSMMALVILATNILYYFLYRRRGII
jgi:MFS family permease